MASSRVLKLKEPVPHRSVSFPCTIYSWKHYTYLMLVSTGIHLIAASNFLFSADIEVCIRWPTNQEIVVWYRQVMCIRINILKIWKRQSGPPPTHVELLYSVLMRSGNREKVLKKKSEFSRSWIVLNLMLRSGKTARKSWKTQNWIQHNFHSIYTLKLTWNQAKVERWTIQWGLCVLRNTYICSILIGLATRTHIEFTHVQLTVTGTDRSVKFFSKYWTKFDTKMAKMKQNYMVIMIMNVPGTLCQLIDYFPGKQGLAINLTWPVLKSKQHMCVLPPLADLCGFSFFLLAFQFGAITKYIINKIAHSLGIKKWYGVN